MLKIEAKSFRDARQNILSTQKVIWDHLLAFKGEIIQKQALFSLPFRTPNNSRVVKPRSRRLGGFLLCLRFIFFNRAAEGGRGSRIAFGF